MIIIHKAQFLIDYLVKQRRRGFSIGFVPTMGALHDAHIALVNRSASECDVTVCSIFINPTQFNDLSDYNKYPVTLESDIHMLAASKASILYAPTVTEVYPEGITSLEHYDLGYLETMLEGEFRPGHFQGVCQVMSRLLKTVDPDKLFMGQKDYQQCMVIKMLLEITHLKATLIACPTQREKDGLAMSSRNMRLSKVERNKAPLIYQVLTDLKEKLAPGNLSQLKQQAVDRLNNSGFRVEYVAIADASTLQPYDDWDGTKPLVVLTAAFLGDVRLIDNMLLNR